MLLLLQQRNPEFVRVLYAELWSPDLDLDVDMDVVFVHVSSLGGVTSSTYERVWGSSLTALLGSTTRQDRQG